MVCHLNIKIKDWANDLKVSDQLTNQTTEASRVPDRFAELLSA